MTAELSAFVEDMRLDALPKRMQKDVLRFVAAKAHHQFPHYGMVVPELVKKADPANMRTARKQTRVMTPKAARDFVEGLRDEKYILVLNDRIIDGHHFLAKAERGGVTSSINVLDLTTARFQFGAARTSMGSPRICTGSIITLMQNDQRREKPKASKIRTAAILAGGAGLGYAGLRVGRAAGRFAHAADAIRGAANATKRSVNHVTPAVHAAAMNTANAAAAATASMPKPRGWLRKLLGFTAPQAPIQFAFPVAQDRYRKGIKHADIEKASGHYTKSAIAGSALGLALRKSSITRGRAAALGAAGGLAAQAITRHATASTKDSFGDRSTAGKVGDGITPAAIGIGALVASSKRLRKKAGSIRAVVGKGARVAGRAIGGTLRDMGKAAIGFQRPASNDIQLSRGGTIRKLIHGGALAGGITVADAATSAAVPHGKQTRTQGAIEGAKRGAIYGTVLAGAEPALAKLLKGVARKRAIKLSAINAQPSTEFGGREQILDEHGRFVDPLAVASGSKTGYMKNATGRLAEVALPTVHGQTIRAALNRGSEIQKWGRRSGGLAADLTSAASGKPKEGGRKREWEKSWFKNAVGTAVAGAGLLAHTQALRKSPRYRAKVSGVVRSAKAAANRVVPDLYPDRTYSAPPDARIVALNAKVQDALNLDVPAAVAGWDVRDPRGRSARVFAPGSRKRDRREKKWHERQGNQRVLGIIGTLAGAAIGSGVTYKLMKKKVPVLKPGASGVVVPFPKQA